MLFAGSVGMSLNFPSLGAPKHRTILSPEIIPGDATHLVLSASGNDLLRLLNEASWIFAMQNKDFIGDFDRWIYMGLEWET